MQELINNKLLFIIVGLLALILPNVYFLRRNRKQMASFYQKIEELAPHLSGRLSKVMQFLEDEPRLIGQFSGHKYTLTYSRPEGQPPNYIILKCYINSSNGLRIFSNSSRSTVLFDKPVLTHDPELDCHMFYSNNPDEAKKYLLSRKLIIAKLSELGWFIPSIGRRSISSATNVNHAINVEEITKALKLLIELGT